MKTRVGRYEPNRVLSRRHRHELGPQQPRPVMAIRPQFVVGDEPVIRSRRRRAFRRDRFDDRPIRELEAALREAALATPHSVEE